MNKLLLIILAVSLLGVGLLTSTTVLAQTTTDNQNQMSSLVSKLAEKFGLNQGEVQAVFDQERSQRHAQMETLFEQQLTQDVKDGKITEAQKQLIIAKRQELQAWASQNNIDLRYLRGGFGGRGHGIKP